MSFNIPQSGGNQNQPQKSQGGTKSAATFGTLIGGIVLLVVGFVWLTLFQNNLELSSESFRYWAPYIPMVLGVILLVVGFKRFNKGH